MNAWLHLPHPACDTHKQSSSSMCFRVKVYLKDRLTDQKTCVLTMMMMMLMMMFASNRQFKSSDQRTAAALLLSPNYQLRVRG